jgi:hypothetical protein
MWAENVKIVMSYFMLEFKQPNICLEEQAIRTKLLLHIHLVVVELYVYFAFLFFHVTLITKGQLIL